MAGQTYFDKDGVRIQGNKISFPYGFFSTSTKIVDIDDIRGIQVLWNNWLHLYFWRFIIGPLGMLTIVGIPEYWKILRGYIRINLTVKKGLMGTEEISFFVHHTDAKTVANILRS